MVKRLCAVWMAILVTGALAAGCGGSSAAPPAVVAGPWGGSLVLDADDGRTFSGAFTVRLTQDGDFAAGVATWTPLGDPQSVTVAIDGSNVTLRIAFLCESLNGGVTLAGGVAGEMMTLRNASGIACLGRGADVRIRSGSGTLLREPTAEPL